MTLEPTPAPMGSPVRYGALEITLLDVITHDLLYPGGSTAWYAKEGYIIIDLGVLVKNLNPGNAVQVTWSNVYIVDAKGDAWYPFFVGTKMITDGNTIDPFSIGIGGTQVNRDDLVEFDNDTYMRLIYIVADDPRQTILFGIGNSPVVSFQVK